MPKNGSSPITFMIIKPQPVPQEKAEISDKPEINPASIKGEPGTGYEGPDGKGDFECCNCTYFEDESLSCGQEDMMAKSKRAKLTNGRVVVHPNGCCEYVNRFGKDDYKEDND